MIVWSEYLVVAILGVLLVAAAGFYLLEQASEQARAAQLIGVAEFVATVVSRNDGVFVELQLQLHSSARVCINYIDVVRIPTLEKATIGDGDSREVSNLPFCVDPHATITIGGFQATDWMLIRPGDKVAVVLHYSIDAPQTTYRDDNPLTLYIYGTAVKKGDVAYFSGTATQGVGGGGGGGGRGIPQR